MTAECHSFTGLTRVSVYGFFSNGRYSVLVGSCISIYTLPYTCLYVGCIKCVRENNHFYIGKTLSSVLASLPLLWWGIGALGRRCRSPGGGARAGRPALRRPGGGTRCPAPRLLDADPQAVDLPGGGGEVTLQLQLPLPQSAIQGMSLV